MIRTMIMIRKLCLVLAVGAIITSTGCAGGESYEIMKSDSIAMPTAVPGNPSMPGQKLVSAVIKGNPTDEKLKEWGKEISDKHAAPGTVVSIIFFLENGNMRATYASGMLMSMAEGGLKLPTSPTQ